MTNGVTLVFKKDIVCLAGYDYGKLIYDTQVNSKIDFGHDFYITIPDDIELIFSSFIQGFLCDIINSIGVSSTKKRIHIISKNPQIEQFFLKELR